MRFTKTELGRLTVGERAKLLRLLPDLKTDATGGATTKFEFKSPPTNLAIAELRSLIGHVKSIASDLVLNLMSEAERAAFVSDSFDTMIAKAKLASRTLADTPQMKAKRHAEQVEAGKQMPLWVANALASTR